MAVNLPRTGNLLVLPPWRVAGVSDSTAGFGKRFAFEDYSWARRPLLSARRAEVPCCWTIEQAALTWADDVDGVDAYVADGQAPADPSPRWGTQGSLLRPPRAVIIERPPPFAAETPAATALADLAEELEAAGIFAGEVDTDAMRRPHLLVRACLLHHDAVTLEESTGDFYEVLEIDEARSVGGEVLFIFENNDVSDFSLTPYWDQNAGVGLDLVRDHDLDLLTRCVPRFARVQYLYLQAGSDLITGFAVAALEDFIAEAPADCIDYRQFSGSFHGSANPSFELARDAAEEVIRTFFSL
jgi:hypothetical protein